MSAVATSDRVLPTAKEDPRTRATKKVNTRDGESEPPNKGSEGSTRC